MAIVRNILDILFPPRETELLVRCTSEEELRRLVSRTLIGPDTVALLPYRLESVRALILEAKFRDSTRAQKLLGQVLGEYVHSQGLTDAVLVPVPLSEKRLKERGYSQVERICQNTGIAVVSDLLVRARDTLPQTTLSKEERRKNVVGAFSAAGQLDPERTYIVVDDVMTTGATCAAAMAALAHEESRILAIALAH